MVDVHNFASLARRKSGLVSIAHACMHVEISLVPRSVFEESDFGSRPGNGALKLCQILVYLLESDSGGSSCLWSGFHCFLIIISIERG